jgi:peptide/nickel transport system substrate-binding protein
VAQFLNSQSQDLSTYARNPLWQMVDGPFTLTQFTTDGFAKFEPNKDYSGAPKPTISAFEELPFTTDAAEFNAVESGSVTIGYIPIPDLKQAASVDSAEGYRVSPWYAYGFNYVAYNFTDPTLGPIFSQLYFRQAAQSLINQPEYIKDFLDGYGLVTNGAVPAFPKDNPFESPLVEKGVVYPYDPSKAVSLLRANGWTVVPGGTSYCARAGGAAGDCGSGIKKGQELKVPVLVGSGNTALMDEMDAMQSTMASKAGIDLELSQEPISDIVSVEYNNCTFASPCPDWAMTASSTYPSWTYSPFFLPTGETLFETGAASNLGDYSNPVDDANIRATNTTVNSKAETAAIFKYENYLAEQLPHAWIPCAPWQVTVYKKTLSGVVPQDASVIIYPQQYRVGGA